MTTVMQAPFRARLSRRGLGLALAALPLAAATVRTARAAPTTFRVASVNGPTHESLKVIDLVTKRITARTEGRVAFQVFPSAQLGSTVDSLEQASQGQPVITYTSASFMAPFGAPELAVFDGPYVFSSKQEADRLVFSSFAEELYDKLAKTSGIRVVALNWAEGERHMIGARPYPTPADLKGVKMRVPSAETWVKTFAPLGVVPVTVEAAEVYSALSQRVVAAAEAPLVAFRASRWYEVAPHITLTRHFYLPNGWATSETALGALAPADRQILMEEFRNGGPEVVKRGEDLEATIRKEFEARNVTFHEADVDAYRKATLGFYSSFPNWPPGLYDRVRAAAAQP